MFIVIVGAGKIGHRLVELCLKDGRHNIVIIDKENEKCEEVARNYDVVAISADAAKEQTLEEVEVKKADVLVTTTSDDAINLLVVSLAKNKGVKNLVAICNQTESRELYIEKGVKVVKSPDLLSAENLFKSIKHPTIEEYMPVGEYAEIFRIPVSEESAIHGTTIAKVGLPKKALIVAIEREQKFIIPTEDVELYTGDKVTVLAHREQVDKVARIFAGRD